MARRPPYRIAFERKSERLLPTGEFIRRVAVAMALGLALMLISLVVGAVGYRATEHMSWIDAFYNAGLILTGMGPAKELVTSAGKIFATIYALFSGIVFLTAAALVLAPIFHRILHHFHADAEEPDKKG